jgi:hypothetical protein
MHLNEYTVHLSPKQHQTMTWPNQGEPRTVYVHVVRLRVSALHLPGRDRPFQLDLIDTLPAI